MASVNGRILVGVDGSEASSRALDMAIELAKALGSWVSIRTWCPTTNGRTR
jgi:nucleotide-binding universal stress UspA family protein